MFTIRLLVAAIALSASLVTTSWADEAVWVNGQNIKSRFMRVYGLSLPPIGHVKFCANNPADCRKKSNVKHDGRFNLTKARWRELKHLNSLINRNIQPVTDKELYGRVEHWTYPTNYKGDCEDYVLLKRQKLIERGWPESSLLITVVLDENREGHAILTVRTAQGDFMLDNKNDQVLRWHQLPYTFVKRQSFRNPRLWVSLLPEKNWKDRARQTAMRQ